MWLSYSNSIAPYSAVERSFGDGMDWGRVGIKSLSLYMHGKATNTLDPDDEPFVAVTDGPLYPSDYAQVTYTESGLPVSDITDEEWHEWNIPIADFTGVTYGSIKSIIIGIGDRDAVGAQGADGDLYFDDIRLYPLRCVPEFGPEYDWSGNCIVDIADIGIMGEEWLRHDAVLDYEAPTVGPVGHWELDEGDGSWTADSSGNFNDGTLEDEYTWVAGKVGDYAIEFTGDDGGRVRVEHSPELMPDTAVSVTAWIYATEEPDYSARIVAKGEDEGDWEPYYMEFDGGVLWAIRDANDANHDNHAVESDNELWLDDWIHVAGTYDGDVVALYVNGQLEDSNSFGDIGGWLHDTNDLSIGNRSDANDRGFIGRIDDVRVYGYALNALQVAYVATAPAYDGYVALNAQTDIYDGEDRGQKTVNFRDLAFLMDYWLDEKLWPPD